MLFVRSCHGSAGREAGSTAVLAAVLAAKRAERHDHARPTAHDHARTTAHARPCMTDHARTTAHDCARPTTAAIFVRGSGTHPIPGGFRGLNCLARLALARERTPSLLFNLKGSFFEPAVGSLPNFARVCGYMRY